jgi:hypothetical protein
MGWGNDPTVPSDLPAGTIAAVNKGLGSYTPETFKKVALYPQFGAEYCQIEYDKETNKSLKKAMRYGHLDFLRFDDGTMDEKSKKILNEIA